MASSSEHKSRFSEHHKSRSSKHRSGSSEHKLSHSEHIAGPSGHSSRSSEHISRLPDNQRISSEHPNSASSPHEQTQNSPSNELTSSSSPGPRPVRPKLPQRTLTLREAMTMDNFLDPITAAAWRNQVRKQEWETEKREREEWKRKEAEKLRNMSHWDHLKALLCFRLQDDDMPHYTFCIGERGGC